MIFMVICRIFLISVSSLVRRARIRDVAKWTAANHSNAPMHLLDVGDCALTGLTKRVVCIHMHVQVVVYAIRSYLAGLGGAFGRELTHTHCIAQYSYHVILYGTVYSTICIYS